MMRYLNRPTLLAAIAVAACALGLAAWYQPFDQWFNYTNANTLLLSGNIEAHESLLSFQVSGRIDDLPVEEGKFVEADAIMARLDDRDYRQLVATDEAALKVAEAQLKLELAGTRHQELEAIRQAMVNAEANFDQRRIDFSRIKQLYEADATSRENFDLADTNLKQARAAYEQAKQNFDEAVEGTRKEEIAIAVAQAEQARENLKYARIQLDHTLLRAPFAGVALVRQAELGEVVSPGTPVYTFADLKHIWLRAYVAETDIGRIRWGEKATITADSLPGKTFTGSVSFISSKAEFTPKSVETHKERVTLVYRIKIDIFNPNYELKPGMPADARLTLLPARGNE
jgi:HlyD family secretion protein